jgi:hypothetical protein
MFCSSFYSMSTSKWNGECGRWVANMCKGLPSRLFLPACENTPWAYITTNWTSFITWCSENDTTVRLPTSFFASYLYLCVYFCVDVECVRSDVFTAVTMKNAVFWDVMPCGTCKNRGFGGTYLLNHQGDKYRQVKMMEAIHFSETLVLTTATRRNIPEDGILHV